MKTYFRGIINTVSSFHSNHICHKNLKPGNIFLVTSDTFVLSDIGLPKNMRENLLCRLSQRYLSPEIYEGYDQGEEGDIWALGVIMLETALGGGSLTDKELRAMNCMEVLRRMNETSIYTQDFTNFVAKCFYWDVTKRAKSKELLKDDWLREADVEMVTVKQIVNVK